MNSGFVVHSFTEAAKSASTCAGACGASAMIKSIKACKNMVGILATKGTKSTKERFFLSFLCLAKRKRDRAQPQHLWLISPVEFRGTRAVESGTPSGQVFKHSKAI
jgi:hypothetical protein